MRSSALIALLTQLRFSRNDLSVFTKQRVYLRERNFERCGSRFGRERADLTLHESQLVLFVEHGYGVFPWHAVNVTEKTKLRCLPSFQALSAVLDRALWRWE